MRPLARLALAGVTLVVVAFAAVAQEGHGNGEGAAVSGEVGGFAPAMDEAMRRMMHDMHRPVVGDPDRDFLAMMIPHHQGAVDMARLVLVHGRDPLTRQLAEQILAIQAVEIEAMRRRLDVLSSAPRGSEYPTLGGTRGGDAPRR